jgi:hypothetical protein
MAVTKQEFDRMVVDLLFLSTQHIKNTHCNNDPQISIDFGNKLFGTIYLPKHKVFATQSPEPYIDTMISEGFRTIHIEYYIAKRKDSVLLTAYFLQNKFEYECIQFDDNGNQVPVECELIQ